MDSKMQDAISWVLVGTSPVTGHWEDSHGKAVTPTVGMTVDPLICDLHWEAALRTLCLTTMKIPGEPMLLHVVSLKSAGRAPIRIKGCK
jgi:hypothetical protein